MSHDAASELQPAALSSAVSGVLRGRFCDVLLRDRPVRSFEPGHILYDLGETQRTLWFIRSGVVKVGTITNEGLELIYDVRKGGDVVGELCAIHPVRRDRAVAVVQTEATPATFDEVIAALAAHPALLHDLVGVFCSALDEAYDQVTRLAGDDIMRRLSKILRTLTGKLGESRGELVEITTYLTQEELAQMVMARRERVSTALNLLRQKGIVQYSPRGCLLVDVRALPD